jgi:hypothetical protein
LKKCFYTKQDWSPYIPFYKEVIDKEGKPKPAYFSNTYSEAYPIRVAKDLFMQAAWRDTIYQRILKSPLGDSNKYVYSDNDFIFRKSCGSR